MADNTTPTVTTSSQFSLNWKDGLKGVLVAFITAFLTVVYTSIQDGALTMSEVKTAGLAGLAGGLSYLLKNFFTPAQTVITPPPPTKP